MKIELLPLNQADTAELAAILNNPAVTAHMPLANQVDEPWVENWKQEKSRQWPEPNMGPWAVTIDGRLAGWSGVQPDGESETELAVVLDVWAWGHGREIAEVTLERWRRFDDGRPIVVYLPFSRPISAIEKRWGWKLLGEAEIAGIRFAKLAMPHTLTQKAR